jgi:hypothetical protein
MFANRRRTIFFGQPRYVTQLFDQHLPLCVVTCLPARTAQGEATGNQQRCSGKSDHDLIIHYLGKILN